MWPFTRKNSTKGSTLDPSTQNSVLARIAQLTKLNLHKMLDEATDPQDMADQIIRDFNDTILAARTSVATAISAVRQAEAQHARQIGEIEQWSVKAEASAQAARRAQEAGDAAETRRLTDLARRAIASKQELQRTVEANEPALAARNTEMEQLKEGLTAMQEKLQELHSWRNDLTIRQQLAETRSSVAGALGQLNAVDPTSARAALERKVERQEAQALGQMEVTLHTLADPYREVIDSGARDEVENELAALMAPPTTKE